MTQIKELEELKELKASRARKDKDDTFDISLKGVPTASALFAIACAHKYGWEWGVMSGLLFFVILALTMTLVAAHIGQSVSTHYRTRPRRPRSDEDEGVDGMFD